MTTAIALDEQTRRRHLVRAVVASTIGTTVEWYDFFLYGSAAALIFPRLFFSNLDPYVANILSYVTFYAGFAARPVCAAIFGHWGDRIGRKALLVITMLLMGVSTTAIGLVPAYEASGLWGAVILTILRALQGIAVGGEWSGSVLMAGEWAAPGRRGFTTSFPQMGAPLGMIMANTALAFTTSSLDESAFLSWGWRIPFLASIVLVGIGLWIRIGILESPVFVRIREEKKIVKAPVVEVLRTNWREVALTALLRTGQLAPYYITTTYILTYGTQVLGLGRAELLNAVSIRSIGSIVMLPVAGHLSDRFGRKRVVGAGLVGTGIWIFALFAGRHEADAASHPRVVRRRHHAGPAVRAAGGSDRRGVPRLTPLHRLGPWVPSGGHHRRRSGAGHRGVSVSAVSLGHGNSRLRADHDVDQPGNAAVPERSRGFSGSRLATNTKSRRKPHVQ